MATEGQQQVTGATPMCANGCGYFGSAATKNLCSQCYKLEHAMKTAAAVAPVAEKKAGATPAESGSSAEVTEKHEESSASGGAAAAEKTKVDAEKEINVSSAETKEKDEAASGAPTAAAPVMCVNGCTFFGSAATKNMCSSCYKDFLLKDAHAAPAVAGKVEVVAPAAPPPEISATTSSSAAPAAKAAPSRCAGAGCKKKVGLLGFVCRCGGTFCAVHRYTNQHACDFDFKTADRDQIAKKNPLIVAPKINKI